MNSCLSADLVDPLLALECKRARWEAAKTKAVRDALVMLVPELSNITAPLPLLTHVALDWRLSGKVPSAAMARVDSRFEPRAGGGPHLATRAQCKWYKFSKYESPLGVLISTAPGRHDFYEAFYRASTPLHANQLFAPLLRQAQVIVITRAVGARDTMRSYSLRNVYGTVYIEASAATIRFAEALLHEATHCWLNELLEASGEGLTDRGQWYSVWKECKRPAYGILHAVLTFAVLILFWHVAQGEWRDDSTARYANARIRKEVGNLRFMDSAFKEVVSTLKEAELRKFSLAIEQAALS